MTGPHVLQPRCNKSVIAADDCTDWRSDSIIEAPLGWRTFGNLWGGRKGGLAIEIWSLPRPIFLVPVLNLVIFDIQKTRVELRQKVPGLALKMISATSLIRCGVANFQKTSFFSHFRHFEKSVISQKQIESENSKKSPNRLSNWALLIFSEQGPTKIGPSSDQILIGGQGGVWQLRSVS